MGTPTSCLRAVTSQEFSYCSAVGKGSFLFLFTSVYHIWNTSLTTTSTMLYSSPSFPNSNTFIPHLILQPRPHHHPPTKLLAAKENTFLSPENEMIFFNEVVSVTHHNKVKCQVYWQISGRHIFKEKMSLRHKADTCRTSH